MSTVIVRRTERHDPPELPSGEILLQSPPEIPEAKQDSFQQTLMYLPMLAMTVGMVSMIAGPTASTVQYVGGGAMALGMGGMMIGQIGRGKGERKIKLNGLRRDYLRYLGQVRTRVRRAAAAQREALEWGSPDPRALPALLIDPELRRIWERRPSGDDFANVRIGTGTHRLAVRLVAPETKPVEDLDPLCAGALRRFVRAHGSVPGLPVGISLRSFARIAPAGDPEAVYGMLRAMIAQLAVFHSPDDVRISVCASRDTVRSWQWIKWLPHNMHPTEADAAGPVRLMAPSLPQLEAMLGGDFADRAPFAASRSAALPFHVVIVDGGEGMADSRLGSDGAEGTVVIDLTPAAATAAGAATASVLRLNITSGGTEMLSRDRTGAEVRSPIGVPDALSLAEADALARQLAPLRPSVGGPADDPLAADTTLTSLLGISSPLVLDVPTLWRPRPPRSRLRVPIGSDADGQPVELDIKESAQGGMGPHGLVIGATGSGKSELLRTLVLGLALTHPSDALNFVLVDFKGGATFLGLDRLAHVSAVITNLADELPLVDRMRDALHGELVRRQELLRSAGNYASMRDYAKAREKAGLPPVPTLFVVIDEFSELLSARPEFIDLFVMIGRLGRSLGVHLLLASQRLEEGKLRGLDTHLSYRIGLRTFSAAESRVVLGVPDAYELPPKPGSGYLKFDTGTMTRFKAAYVSGPAATGRARTPQRQAPPVIVPFGPGYMRPAAAGAAAAGAAAPEEGPVEPSGSLLDVVVTQLAGHGPPAHQIWLPPLDVPPTLDQLLPPLSITEQYGCTVDSGEWRGRLCAVTGIVDRPFEQRCDPLWVDLSAAAGQAAVVGAPRSGKSTMLRTLICSLALLHTPREVQFYCLDFGGGSLSGLASLPHVGGVATRLEGTRVRRTVAEVQGVLTRREREFADRGIESISAHRRMLATGEVAGDGFGDVFLVVDGWLTLRQDFEQLEQAITAIAARGLGYGVHVLATAGKWSEFRPAIRDLFGTRLELRLGDPYESEIDRKLAMNVPEGSPGRGITREGRQFLTALPRVDGQPTADNLGDGVRKLAEVVAATWPGEPAPQVRLLPDALPVSALPGIAQTGTRIPFGVDESTLSPVFLDFGADPHFLVFGDTECGKSNLLRLIAESVAGRYTPDEARLIFVDYRRSLLDSAEGEHRIGYAASSAAAASLISDVREAMVKRLPPPDLTSQQLRSRSWWKGSDLFLVVDDYDLVAGASNPLLPLADLVPQARDIGLHLILARSGGGAGRAMFDPMIQRIREMGSPGLIMSGNKDEGALLGGVRPQAQPPGRGHFVERRKGTNLVQTALLDDGAGPPPGRGTASPAPLSEANSREADSELSLPTGHTAPPRTV
ncbi:MAG: segregation ATPase FtsK/SpoIIIE, family [Streptosporangiaceae bacterium]|nr:segregation ATPase FtsK/SpoIIIE, family [Streptosporangiaceae bacterium]